MKQVTYARNHVRRNDHKSQAIEFSNSRSNSHAYFPTGNVSKEMISNSFVSKIRYKYSHLLIWGLALCMFSLFYVSLPPTVNTVQNCNCKDKEHILNNDNFKAQENNTISSLRDNSHKLALLIPFRDRFEELLEFVPHINKFLRMQNIHSEIYVLNQVDNLRFNRASLLNVGFLESSSTCDYVSLHDVDLLPMNLQLQYKYPEAGPFHIAAPHLHPRYHYPTFIGGILLITRHHYRKVNGLSNKYWGWGLEDDELYARFQEARLDIFRPGNLTTNTTNTFRHIHDRKVRKRDMVKCYNQQLITRRRDRETGLSTTKYSVQSRRQITIDGAPVTVINIILECNRSITPWCDCKESVGNTKSYTQQKSTVDVIVPKLDRKIHLNPHG